MAGAIAGVIRERPNISVRAIGHAAIGQAIKGITVARRYVRDDGYDPAVVPEFQNVFIDGKELTATDLLVYRRTHGAHQHPYV